MNPSINGVFEDYSGCDERAVVDGALEGERTSNVATKRKCEIPHLSNENLKRMNHTLKRTSERPFLPNES
jgi:hypothetical protein